MKTTKIEGFEITHDAVDLNEVYPIVLDIIEQVIISGMGVNIFYHKNLHRGYHRRSLEPFRLRETKKDIVLDYTGAMGGSPYRVRIAK